MSGKMTIDVEVNTSNAKKDLQKLASQTSENISVSRNQMENRTFGNKSNTGSTGGSNMLGDINVNQGLRALITSSIPAAVVAFQAVSHEVNEFKEALRSAKKRVETLENRLARSKDVNADWYKSTEKELLRTKARVSSYEGKLAEAKTRRNATITGAPKEMFSKMAGGFTNMASGALRGVGVSSALAGTLAGVLGAGAVVAAIGGAIAKAWKSAVMDRINEGQGAQKSIENINASLGTISKNFTGNFDVSDLTEDIMLLGVNGVNSIESLSSAASTLLLAFQGNSDEVKKWLPIIDDLSAATGMSSDSIGAMIARLGETEFVESRVFNTLATRGIPVYERLAEVMGVTTEEAKKAAKAGQVTSEVAQQAIQKLGQLVKGTSSNLSSMTIEGAEASAKASGELEHAGYARGYNEKRMEYLNELTEEQLKNANDISYQIDSQAAGIMMGKLTNAFQIVGEWAEGWVDDFVNVHALVLGFDDVAIKNRLVQVQKGIDGILKKDNSNAYQEDLEKDIKAFQKFAEDIEKLSKVAGDEEAEAFQKIIDTLNYQIDQYTELKNSLPSRAEEEKAAKIRENQEEYRQFIVDENYKKVKESDTSDVSVMTDAINDVLRNRYNIDNLEQLKNVIDGLKSQYESGEISDIEKSKLQDLIKILDTYNNDIKTVTDRYNDLKQKELEEKERQLEEEKRLNKLKVTEQNKYLSLQGDLYANTRQQIIDMQESIGEMETLNDKEKQQAYDSWFANEREKSLMSYKAGNGDPVAQKQLEILDEWKKINDYVGLTQEERAEALDKLVQKTYNDLAAKTRLGEVVGSNPFTGEFVFGTAEIELNPEQLKYLNNAWGAACVSFMQFDDSIDRKALDELREQTQINRNMNHGISELVSKFTISAQ